MALGAKKLETFGATPSQSGGEATAAGGKVVQLFGDADLLPNSQSSATDPWGKVRGISSVITALATLGILIVGIVGLRQPPPPPPAAPDVNGFVAPSLANTPNSVISDEAVTLLWKASVAVLFVSEEHRGRIQYLKGVINRHSPDDDRSRSLIADAKTSRIGEINSLHESKQRLRELIASLRTEREIDEYGFQTATEKVVEMYSHSGLSNSAEYVASLDRIVKAGSLDAFDRWWVSSFEAG